MRTFHVPGMWGFVSPEKAWDGNPLISIESTLKLGLNIPDEVK
jgi:hypothetical protein